MLKYGMLPAGKNIESWSLRLRHVRNEGKGRPEICENRKEKIDIDLEKQQARCFYNYTIQTL